ncbi:protein-disulfide reductase [Sarracenia purpurea var. burkii]
MLTISPRPKWSYWRRKWTRRRRRLPRSEKHAGHRHELTLVSEGSGRGPFICCDCEEQGSGWAYQCIDCGYEVHPKCVRPPVVANNAPANGD